MPATAEPPTQYSPDQAQDVFSGVKTFETHVPEPTPQKAPEKPAETAAPETTNKDGQQLIEKPDAMKSELKDKLGKLGKVSKPEVKKEEAKPNGQNLSTEDKPETFKEPKQLREAYEQVKKEKEALRSELDKMRPDFEKVAELRQQIESSNQELAKLKALQLNDEERSKFDTLRKTHARYEMETSKEYQEKVAAPIKFRTDKIEKAAKFANLSPAGTSALINAMDVADEFQRDKEIRRIFTEAEMAPEDLATAFNAMSQVGRELNDTLYPLMDKMLAQAEQVQQAARAKKDEDAQMAKTKEQEEFKKEADFVRGVLTKEALAVLMEDSDLSIEGVTLKDALEGAEPATTPRERALEVQSAAALPFVISKLNKALEQIHQLEQANKIRNGSAPSRNDGVQKPNEVKEKQMSADEAFKAPGLNFGGR